MLGTVSARENIYARAENQSEKLVDIIGKEPQGDEFDFFVRIGNNYHRVIDCGNGQKLAQILNTHLDYVELTSETSLQAWGLVPRPSLSCDSSRPTGLKTPVYLDNFTTYYFSTGKKGEYYTINQDCGYAFYSALFQVEKKARQFQAPTDQKTLITLRCGKTAASVGDYALYFVEDARAGGIGGLVIVLSYRSQRQQPAWIVISKIDGQYLKKVAREKITSIIEQLKGMNYGVKPLIYFPFKLAKDEPWFDICLDNCKGERKTLAQLAKDRITRKGESYQKLTFSKLRFMACDNLLNQLLPDKPLPTAAEKQSDDWFAGMQAELKQLATHATLFKCPTEVCARQVPGGDYTVAEFQSKVSDVAECKNKSQLHLTLLGNVTITGAQPIRIQSRTFKSITIEGYGQDVSLTYQNTGKGDAAFSVGKNKQFGLKKLKIKTAHNRPLKAIIKASKAKLKLDNVSVTGNASTALKLNNSTLYCFSCRLKAQKYGIIATNAQMVAHGNGLISGKRQYAIYLSGKSEAIVEGMTLNGKSLLFIGTKSRALIDKAQLKPSSSVAFTLFSKNFPSEKGYALSIKNSQIFLANLQPTEFTMVKFHRRSDGSGHVELGLKLDPLEKRVFDKSYLRCKGQRLGKLIFEGRDYCTLK